MDEYMSMSKHGVFRRLSGVKGLPWDPVEEKIGYMAGGNF